MKTMRRLSLTMSIAVLTFASSAARAGVLTGSANAVLGQQVFTSSAAVNVTCDETMLNQPYSIAVDTANDRLFVSDSGYNRVLWWDNASSLADNAGASGVLGQTDFFARTANRGIGSAGQDRFNCPLGIALDGAGRLWVADINNNRVLRFDLAVSTCNADLVLGQGGFGSNAPATTQSRLRAPTGVTVDSNGHVWVADAENNRVVRFSSSSLANGAAADIVLGTTTFTAMGSGSSSALGLKLPQSVKVDSAGNVYVAEYANNRVVKFDAPISSGMPAAVVLGQSGFNLNAADVTQSGMQEPFDVCVDTGGNVWVAMFSEPPSYHSRVVRYAAPLSTGMNADIVLGQANFTDRGYNRMPGQAEPAPAANGLFRPAGVTVDPAGRIWIADKSNNRVVRYDRAVSPDTAVFVLGQPDLTHRESTRTDDSSINNPYALAIDTTTNRLFAADYANNRVLWWNNAASFSSGAAADGVLGQSYFGGNSTNADDSVSSVTLRGPAGVAVDPAGNIWVADRDNNRVLRFAGAGLASGMPAHLVLGQADFVTASSGTATTTNLAAPTAVRIDRDGYIWVADASHHRVVRYAKQYFEAFSNNEAVDVVLGQDDATSGTVNQGQPGACQWGLYDPTDINFDSANAAWVVDRGNNRVLRFSSAAIAADALGAWADGVIGQLDYTSTGAAATMDGLNQPRSVGFTPGGNIVVSDAGNARLLIYGAVTTFGSTAVRAVGQAGVVAQNTLNQPRGTACDAAGNLLIADAYFNRILRFSAPAADSVSPAQASVSDGTLTAVLSGHDFGAAMHARMERSGCAAITASTVTVTSDTQITMTFPLAAAATGYWDVVVSTLGFTARCANAIRVTTETVSLPAELNNTTQNIVTYTVGTASVTLNIPADTFPDTFTMSCTAASLSEGLDQSGLAATPVALELTHSRGQQPRRGITITIAYTDAAMAGADERTLVICYYDTARRRWIQIASTPDPDANTVTGVITHLTVFRIFARVPATGLDNVTVYPNPYKPSAAGYGNSVLGAGVVFGNITENARIRIYTIDGALVRDEAVADSNGTWVWDTRTDGGDTAASGVYVYYVTTPGSSSQKATGKIAIIR